MNKSELIDRIADKAETSKAAAAKVLDAIFDASSGAIAEAVRTGREVKLPGFGKFASRQRAARKGRNPRTGTEIDIPESTVITFSAGKGLKDTVATRGGGAQKSGGAKAGSGTGAKSSGSGTTGKKPAGAAKAAGTSTGAKKTGSSSGGKKAAPSSGAQKGGSAGGGKKPAASSGAKTASSGSGSKGKGAGGSTKSTTKKS